MTKFNGREGERKARLRGLIFDVKAMADGRLKDKNGRLDGRFRKDNLPCSNPVYIGIFEDYGRLLGLFQNGGN